MEKSRSYPNNSSEFRFKNGRNPYVFNGSSTSTDPEMKRKKRVAAYNMFTKEAGVKASVNESFKWIKTKFSYIRYSL
ncbi:hypothetical protein CDL12_13392 [Handroanthus impetiginosus]|uniref:Uncharacterized protein n=1 Tax=Handroanthus impetiginosus TaxID=429701 RepID=A0A2G9H8Z1_9LAMI|nr:hypothetical protein CDL12_13392 [Handroanthus impetiginosus]